MLAEDATVKPRLQGPRGRVDPARRAQAGRGRHRVLDPRRAGRGAGAHARPHAEAHRHPVAAVDQHARPVGSTLAVERPARSARRQPRHRPQDHQPGHHARSLPADLQRDPRHLRLLWQPPAYAFDPAQAKKLLADAGYANGFDAGDYYLDIAYANVQEAVANYLQQVGSGPSSGRWSARLTGAPTPTRSTRTWPTRRLALRQRGDPAGELRRHRRGLRIRRLPGHRLALQGPGGRARPQEARGPASQDPAAHAREGHAHPDLGAGLHQRPRAARAGVGARPHPRPRLLGALRGREAQGQVIRDDGLPHLLHAPPHEVQMHAQVVVGVGVAERHPEAPDLVLDVLEPGQQLGPLLRRGAPGEELVDVHHVAVPLDDLGADAPGIDRGHQARQRHQHEQRQQQHLDAIGQRRRPEWQVASQQRRSRLVVPLGLAHERELQVLGREGNCLGFSNIPRWPCTEAAVTRIRSTSAGWKSVRTTRVAAGASSNVSRGGKFDSRLMPPAGRTSFVRNGNRLV